ncbi:MAG: PilZ domain-containing protein [Aestuariivirga sp.]|nr:PilZ domain-containing protein [Aestuariivirga sp.]
MLNDGSKEQRKNPRHKVLKDGKIISSDMGSVIDVKIRDVSDGGARIQVPAAIDLPEEFGLLMISQELLYPAVVKWRTGQLTGIEFISEPRHLSPNNLGKPTGPKKIRL